MIRSGLTFNGKRIALSSQLRREFEKSIETQVRRAAPPGVRVTKTAKGFEAKGSADAMARMVKRLGK